MLTVGPAGRIDASGKGYFHNAAVNIYPAHGGRFSSSSSVAAYGDVKFPQDIGFAANQGTDAPTSKRAADKARVDLSASLFLKSASLASGTVLDLAGKTFTVRGMTAGGAKIASGIYAAGSSLFTDGYVVDSVGGGQVVVLGAGTVIVVR